MTPHTHPNNPALDVNGRESLNKTLQHGNAIAIGKIGHKRMKNGFPIRVDGAGYRIVTLQDG